MSATTDWKLGRHSHPGPLWYSTTLSARFGPDPLGGYCHSSHTGCKPESILAAYHWPLRPLIGENLAASFGGGLLVLFAGDLNANHMDWNSRLSTKRGKLLRDYADENSCLIFGPESPTTNPYNSSDTPRNFDIMITNNLSFPMYLASCSGLSSDHIPVLIDTACRSSFHLPPDRPNFRQTNWANFQTHLDDIIPFDPKLHNQIAIVTCVENLSGAVLKALAHSTPKRRSLDDPRPPIPAVIQDGVVWKLTAEAVAFHQEPRSGSEGQPPAEVCDPPAQRVVKRPVERDIQMPRSWR